MANEASPTEQRADERYYRIATPGSLAEWLVIKARDRIYDDFVRLTSPGPATSIVDVGVSDVVGEAANVLERKHPWRGQIVAAGLGSAREFRETFPEIAYRQIQPGAGLPFTDGSFDIATSNAVLEHVGSEVAQREFIRELMRVAKTAFISVPHKFFPVEHHTGLPFLHWHAGLFALSTRLLGKSEWSDSQNLILMTRARLRALRPASTNARIGWTGIHLGPFSSNLFMLLSRT